MANYFPPKLFITDLASYDIVGEKERMKDSKWFLWDKELAREYIYGNSHNLVLYYRTCTDLMNRKKEASHSARVILHDYKKAARSCATLWLDNFTKRNISS